MEMAVNMRMRLTPRTQGTHRQPLKRVPPSAEETTIALALMNMATLARFLRAS
jgi:hypothetical protein